MIDCMNEINKYKKEAVENHRKMWNWIADRICETNELVTKKDYFDMNDDIKKLSSPFCYCCKFKYEVRLLLDTMIPCSFICPFNWISYEGVDNECSNGDSPYTLFNEEYYRLSDTIMEERDYTKLADFARQIANLPEKENYEEKLIDAIERF